MNTTGKLNRPRPIDPTRSLATPASSPGAPGQKSQKTIPPGFFDPLEPIPEAKKFVEGLLRRYKSNTVGKVAKLIFNAVMVKEKEGGPFCGLTAAQGGLCLTYDEDFDHPQRLKTGQLLPQEILQSKPEERIALCLEASMLLVVLFRAAGIEAYYKSSSEHASVIAVINGKKIEYDPIAGSSDQVPSNTRYCNDDTARAVFYVNASIFLGEQGEKVKALATAEAAVACNPNCAEAWNAKGCRLSDLERIDEASFCFQRAVQEDRDCWAAYTNLARIEHDKGNFVKARAYLDSFITRLSPHHRDPYYYMGSILLELKQPKAAIPYFQQALMLDPADPDAYEALGDAHKAIGEKETAREMYLRAKELEVE